jgi:hypothetical protein
MEEPVSKTEYNNHKNSCSKSFDNINALQVQQNDQLELLNRAVFGDKKLDEKGIYEMTKDMYKATMYAKGGQKLFVSLVKMAGGFLAITGAFWGLIELFKRIKIN